MELLKIAISICSSSICQPSADRHRISRSLERRCPHCDASQHQQASSKVWKHQHIGGSGRLAKRTLGCLRLVVAELSLLILRRSRHIASPSLRTSDRFDHRQSPLCLFPDAYASLSSTDDCLPVQRFCFPASSVNALNRPL